MLHRPPAARKHNRRKRTAGERERLDKEAADKRKYRTLSEDRKALVVAVGAALDDIAKPYRRCPVRTDKGRTPRL